MIAACTGVGRRPNCAAMATIQDVARAAGVSTATVSRVLSNPDIVAPPTRDRVMRAVQALRYTPNVIAKMLRTHRTDKILVTVPDISNPFFGRVIRGVEEAAHTAGYSVLLGDTWQRAEREERFGEMLYRKEADGLIFLGHRLPDSIGPLLVQLGGRAPVVNGCEFSPELEVSSAHIDNAAAAKEVMDHLYGLGHHRIGVITGELRSPISRDRLAGVRLAAKEHGALDNLMIEPGSFAIESGFDNALHLMDRNRALTAIFCFSDELAMSAMAAVRQRGKRCPEDISIAGFDDMHFSEYLSPPLTTVRQPAETIGRETVRLLLDIILGDAKTVENVTLPHHLIVRDSTASPLPT